MNQTPLFPSRLSPRCTQPGAALRRGLALLALSGLAGCDSYLPYDGPRTSVVESAATDKTMQGIEVVPVSYAIAARLTAEANAQGFSGFFTDSSYNGQLVAPGDALAVMIWESPPAMLFPATTTIGSAADGVAQPGASVSLPGQVVDDAGNITIPYAGQVHVAGLTPSQVGARIAKLLAGKANHPQVLVQLAQNKAQSVTIVGAVQHSLDVPITPGGLRLLNALAEAGGVRGQVEQTAIQLTRSGQTVTVPLQTILMNPAENILLQPGDVVTALYQPLRVTLLGAAGSNKVINFSSGQTSLAEALAKAGGLDDNRSDSHGVFVFRFVDPKALDWPTKPKLLVHGKVPVIFAFNMSNPATFFAAQAFQMQNQDLVYISNAPITSLSKVLNVVGAIVYPFSTLNNYGLLK